MRLLQLPLPVSSTDTAVNMDLFYTEAHNPYIIRDGIHLLSVTHGEKVSGCMGV